VTCGGVCIISSGQFLMVSPEFVLNKDYDTWQMLVIKK
jgi:hypothetical protein